MGGRLSGAFRSAVPDRIGGAAYRRRQRRAGPERVPPGEDPRTRGRLAPLRSLLVSVGGELIEEHYFNGAAAHRSANLKSASKTIIAILVGIAIDRGYLEGVDQPILDFFPDELADAEAVKRSITVGDLLSMRSGLETTSNRNYGRWVRSRHWVRHALSRPLVDRPGGRMIYSTGSTHLLSAILTRASGMSTLEFGRRYLARPLGITLPAWTRDPQGVYLGGNEMGLTPRAMLAIGDLFRRGGSRDGLQVISRGVDSANRRFRGRGHGSAAGSTATAGGCARLAGHPTYYAWGYGGAVHLRRPRPGRRESWRRRRRIRVPGGGGTGARLDDLINCDLVPAIRRAVAEAA